MKTHCRVCGSSKLFSFLNLGFSPPADQFLRENQLGEPETHYPLNVLMCSDCGLAQLSHVVPCEILYRRDYPYESSITKSGQMHWDEFAKTVCTTYGLTSKDLVVDIGSNVGVLLSAFKKYGASILGVDPASNIVRIAEKRGIETIDEFLIPSVVEKIIDMKGKAKIITATNVFAHIDDLQNFIIAVKLLLDDNGIFIIEAPYFGKLLEYLEYDTIYHEHLSYLLLKPIMRLADMHDMEVIDVQERDIHGGSFRVFISRKGDYEINESVIRFIDKEKKGNYVDESILRKFSQDVSNNRLKLQDLIRGLRTEGKKIAGVSAPAKGMTLLNYCRLGPESLSFVTEKSNLKIGRFCPGVHIPVVSDSKLLENNIEYALLLAWNFSEEIMNNLSEFRARGGKFIIPIPEPRIV